MPVLDVVRHSFLTDHRISIVMTNARKLIIIRRTILLDDYERSVQRNAKKTSIAPLVSIPGACASHVFMLY